ncbi:hypothetical protein AKJ57_04080 [candidate division MSBL1 archaeon SCGC-AAA259A05]|uniref:Uncharacterized protein n=1 Tax=candidate division MSBL1 archaeon SCGC-AAA259A05 TaxID=1698259 RepID=A0A133U8N3_9EURY|nr:hypothetical protein AKJ57_04080 [candidate division MSBL1 archaeon SCGC-AAA259A05]
MIWKLLLSSHHHWECWKHPQICYAPLTGLGKEDYRDPKEEAEAKGVCIEEFFIEKNYDEIEKIAEELGVSPEEVEEIARKSRKFRKTS